MTTRYVPAKLSIKFYNSYRISSFLLQDTLYAFETISFLVFLNVDRLKEHLHISESIGPKSLNSLVRLGLDKRFPDECGIWMKDLNAIRSSYRKDMEAKQKEAQDQLSDARTQTESSIRFAVVNAVFSDYPFVLAPLCGVLLTNKCTARLIVPDTLPQSHSPLMRNQD
jgi:hypothetical protein